MSDKSQRVFYLRLMPLLSYNLLESMKPQLFDVCIRQKNNDFFLELIRARGVFSNIPSGSDSTEILERLLFIENPAVKKISSEGMPKRRTEELFWLLFYSELMVEREKKNLF